MDADLDTLATALYARIDDVLKEHPELAPWRPKVGIAPKLSAAELLTLAVLQVRPAVAPFPHGGGRARPAGVFTIASGCVVEGANRRLTRMHWLVLTLEAMTWVPRRRQHHHDRTRPRFLRRALAGTALMLGSALAAPPSGTVNAYPSDCTTQWWYLLSEQVPEAPSASAAGIYANTCMYQMYQCSGGVWTKGQWIHLGGTPNVDHFVTTTSCYSNDFGHYHSNSRAQCADYTGGDNYASCMQRYKA